MQGFEHSISGGLDRGSTLKSVLCVQGRSVHTYNMLVETRYLCNPVKSADNVYSALDNKLIYLSGTLSTSGPVTDSQYGVSGEGRISLCQSVTSSNVYFR